MKGFIVALLLAGTALFLAALLWPDHSSSVSTRNQQSQPVAASAMTREALDFQNRVDDAESRPQLATLAAPATANSVPSSIEPSLDPTTTQRIDAQLTLDEQLTLKQTGTDDTSLRNVDFPRTFISKIHVDLASPNHWVSLIWSGPNASLQVVTRYHSSPGRGLGYNNCDDPAESCRVNSNCTPKGTMHVEAFSNSMVTSPECRYVTWFDTKRGIALHYYPNVPNYPASHGCVRLNEYAAQLIHNNSKIGETEVTIDGKWTFGR